MGVRSRRKRKRRGRPVFAFIDPDVSDRPFLVDRVPFTGFDEVRSLIGGLLSLFDLWGGWSVPATSLYVTDPGGETYEVARFRSEDHELEWIERARRAVVERGAPAMADMSDSAAFRRRYGTPIDPDALLARAAALEEESKRA